jgi:hypothetical protein
MPVDPLAPTLPPAPVAGGLVINGRRVPVPGVELVTWLDDPKRAPRVTDGVRRDADEAIAMLWHTSLGILCREALPDAIPSRRAEDLAQYQARSPKPLSWHITGDTDGTFLQQQDLELWTTWHAGWASGWTVGGELAQRDRRGQLTRPQILAAADVTDAICAAMEFPRRVLVAPDGKPWLGPVLDLVSPRAKHYKTGANLGGRGKTWAGVITHSHVAHREAGDGKGHGNGRGPGDAGPLLFEELLARGYDGHVVLPGGRISPDPMPRRSP